MRKIHRLCRKKEKRRKSTLIHWMGRSACSCQSFYPREAISDREGKEPVVWAGVLDSAQPVRNCVTLHLSCFHFCHVWKKVLGFFFYQHWFSQDPLWMCPLFYPPLSFLSFFPPFLLTHKHWMSKLTNAKHSERPCRYNQGIHSIYVKMR